MKLTCFTLHQGAYNRLDTSREDSKNERKRKKLSQLCVNFFQNFQSTHFRCRHRRVKKIKFQTNYS